MTSQQRDHPLRFMNTIDPIETALAAVTDTERALDAAFSNAQPGDEITELVRACTEAKATALAAGASGTQVMLAASEALI